MNNIQEFIDYWKSQDKNKPEKYKKIYLIYKKDNKNIDILDEDKIMNQFVLDNPFISFKEFKDIIIKNNLIDTNNKNYKIPYEFYLLSKILYENPTNENKIKEIGYKIYSYGDTKLMRFIYSILSIIHKQYNCSVIKGQNVIYDIYWSQIIENWKISKTLLSNIQK